MKAFTSRCAVALMACAIMLAALGSALAGTLPERGALSSPDAMQLIKTLGDKLTVIDVRTEEEFAQGHIPGALLLPVQTLRQQMDKVPADRPILIVCRTGHRASMAYGMISEAMPKKQDLWFLRGVPSYAPDGSYTFK